ncbi:facilitated trehalose transporter Tret1-like [Homalodisca vitripennis]|uniref:facilitated trehalose transporter Tret1-like n=1 Tax=Homalodisca vitripennis TaxID=197043 RepID=UPI001EEA7CC1|nr:facilitated trehalose transporter Tret1-like [Homalodisca vitripennis]
MVYSIKFAEYAGFFRQLLAGSAASLGVLTCAFPYAWLTPILPQLLSPDSEIPMDTEGVSWMLIMPEFGTLISALPAGFLADRIGRKTVILISAPIFLIGWIFILYTKSLLIINIARVFQGLGVGIIYTVMPMYLGEIASPKYRGAITSIFYFFWWFGYLFEYILGPMLSYFNYTLATASINIFFFIAFIFQPESPYYYLMKKKVNSAHKSLTWLLQSNEDEVDKELERMKKCVEEDQQRKVVWNELVATPTDRKALLILLIVGFLRLFCGLIALSSYSTETLKAAGDYFMISPDNCTIIIGIMMVIGSIGSFFTLDVFGRKSLLYFSCSLSAICMFSAGTFYLLKSHSSLEMTPYSWIPPVAFTILAGVSVVGIFPVNIAYASELFTSNTRGMASSVFSFYATILGIFVLKFYLTLADLFGEFVNFYIYTAACIIGVFLTWFIMPETKGKTFERIRHELER